MPVRQWETYQLFEADMMNIHDNLPCVCCTTTEKKKQRFYSKTLYGQCCIKVRILYKLTCDRVSYRLKLEGRQGNYRICTTAVNALRSEQNDRHFRDVFKCIFLKDNICFLTPIPLKLIPNDVIENKSVLVLTYWSLPQPTRTTRTPAFWEYLRRPGLPILSIHIGSLSFQVHPTTKIQVVKTTN